VHCAKDMNEWEQFHASGKSLTDLKRDGKQLFSPKDLELAVLVDDNLTVIHPSALNSHILSKKFVKYVERIVDQNLFNEIYSSWYLTSNVNCY
jgi:hypothetical protein